MFSIPHHAVWKQQGTTESHPHMNSDPQSCTTEMQSGGPLFSACLMRAADKLNLKVPSEERKVGGRDAGGLDKDISYWGLFSVEFK